MGVNGTPRQYVVRAVVPSPSENTSKITLRVNKVHAQKETADRLTTARLIELSGDIEGSAYFDGSEDVILTATVNKITREEIERVIGQ